MVVAGVVAKKIYGRKNITAKLLSAGGSEDIEDAINRAIADNDSVGGIIECVVKDPPLGLGEPFFYSFESALSHIVFSIPAVKGIEFGSGFASASIGDLFIMILSLMLPGKLQVTMLEGLTEE
jgi:chorismate synthase